MQIQSTRNSANLRQSQIARLLLIEFNSITHQSIALWTFYQKSFDSDSIRRIIRPQIAQNSSFKVPISSSWIEEKWELWRVTLKEFLRVTRVIDLQIRFNEKKKKPRAPKSNLNSVPWGNFLPRECTPFRRRGTHPPNTVTIIPQNFFF